MGTVQTAAASGILFLLIAAHLCSGVTGLKCWRCSSDISNAAYCEDPFNVTAMSEAQRKWSYVDCVLPVSHIDPALIDDVRPICKKMIQKVHDKTVFSRSCSYERKDASPDHCRYNTHTPHFVRMLYCESCSRDGCNGDNSRLLSTHDPARTGYAEPAGQDSGAAGLEAAVIVVSVVLLSGMTVGNV